MRRLAAAALVLVLVLCGCARLDYPRLGIHEPVVNGGQAEIDAGHVVDVGLGWVHWLAAHRSSHGSVFARLPEARTGDVLTYDGRRWHVTARLIVPQSLWIDRSYGSLVLQTSLPDSRVLLVVCEPT